MSPELHSRLMAHGVAVVGEVTVPAADAHARLRASLGRRYPTGLGSYVFWRREAPGELHFSDHSVAALVASL